MADFEHDALKEPLDPREARGLLVDLVSFLDRQPAPQKPLTGSESWGGDASLLKRGSARRGR